MEKFVKDKVQSHLSSKDYFDYVFERSAISVHNFDVSSVKKSYEFLNNFISDKVVYGINTGFGPMAQHKVDSAHATDLQYNLVRSHASGRGAVLAPQLIRAVMISRLNTLAQSGSGVSENTITQIISYLKHGIYPFIHEHGGVGASGDLVQLAHLALGLIGEGKCWYKGKEEKVSGVLQKLNLKPLQLKLRDGLALVNGTSCMSGIGMLNCFYAKRLTRWAIYTSALLNEIAGAYDDSFSKELNEVKLHRGQQIVARKMRKWMQGSTLIRNRNKEGYGVGLLHQNEFSSQIQEYYSLRCVPQIIGPIWDLVERSLWVLEKEINSVNDNPVVRMDLNEVFHGGNFHGDYVALEMDKLRLGITKLSILLDRQLNFLYNSALNKKFAPFLNMGKLGLNFGFQGMQYASTSTVAENQALSTSMYIHSIPSNNDNQDVVSMGSNAALMTKKVIENTFEVMALKVYSVFQGVQLLKEKDGLNFDSHAGKCLEAQFSPMLEVIKQDLPRTEALEQLSEYLKNNNPG